MGTTSFDRPRPGPVAGSGAHCFEPWVRCIQERCAPLLRPTKSGGCGVALLSCERIGRRSGSAPGAHSLEHQGHRRTAHSLEEDATRAFSVVLPWDRVTRTRSASCPTRYRPRPPLVVDPGDGDPARYLARRRALKPGPSSTTATSAHRPSQRTRRSTCLPGGEAILALATSSVTTSVSGQSAIAWRPANFVTASLTSLILLAGLSRMVSI